MDILEMWGLPFDEHLRGRGPSKTEEFDQKFLNLPENENEFFIHALREENVPGTHIINYSSPIDSIQMQHIAHSRDGFALGAILAAEWIKNKKGIFTMKDVLQN